MTKNELIKMLGVNRCAYSGNKNTMYIKDLSLLETMRLREGYILNFDLQPT